MVIFLLLKGNNDGDISGDKILLYIYVKSWLICFDKYFFSNMTIIQLGKYLQKIIGAQNHHYELFIPFLNFTNDAV
jgi:hypothetical protein